MHCHCNTQHCIPCYLIRHRCLFHSVDKVDSQSYFEMSQLLTVKKTRQRERERERERGGGGGRVYVYLICVRGWMGE